KGKSDSGNQRFILSIHEGKIALDKPRAFTYHTRACAKGLISSALGFQTGNRGNRGADSHAE
ncbi:MAG: hypothetical protein OEV08_06105, partial [Nitrospira sp.]|nr:hypothetical protein [Nitrospira sp.]